MTAPPIAFALGAVASWRLDLGWALPAFWYLAGLSVLLVVHDLRTRRLPNRLTLPAYPALAALLAVGTVGSADPGRLARALLAGAAVLIALGLLHAARPTGLGAGDVKLGGVLGMTLGWLSWDAVMTGLTLALVLGAAMGLVARRRRGPSTAFAFGPALLAGTWLALLA